MNVVNTWRVCSVLVLHRKESFLATKIVDNFFNLQLFDFVLTEASACCQEAVSGPTTHLKNVFMLSQEIWNFSPSFFSWKISTIPVGEQRLPFLRPPEDVKLSNLRWKAMQKTEERKRNEKGFLRNGIAKGSRNDRARKKVGCWRSAEKID